MWVLLLILAALAGVASFVLAGDARRRGDVGWVRVFVLAYVVAAFLVGAALQWGLG